MKIKLFLFKNWLLFFAINFLFIQLAVAQTHGDYRSNGTGLSSNLAIWQIFDSTIGPSGDWRSATWTDGLPGQNSGTYTVTISVGNIVTIASDITSALTGPVHIFGELVIGDSTPRVIQWNSSLFIIESTGIVRFQDQRSILKLPTSAVLTIKSGGSIAGACSNNTEIYIGDDLIAVCVGGGGKVLTFNQLIAGGGSLDSEINQPISLAVFCFNQSISLEGKFVGTPVGTVNYEWKIFDANLAEYLIGFSGSKTGTLANDTSVTTPATFTPTSGGDYYISFSVSDSNVTNVETHKITVDTTPPIAIAKDVIVQLNDLGTASVTPEQVNNGSSDNCGITSMSLSRSTFSCSDAKPILSDLIISEYVEGSSYNKYIEIFNGTLNPINLSDYRLRIYFNGSTSSTFNQILSGTLASGSTMVYKHGSATIFLGATSVFGLDFNGNDAIELYKISTNAPVDIFGRIGEDPGTAWTIGGNSTVAKTLRRKSAVLNGITVNPTSGFPTLASEWEQFTIDDASGLGSHNTVPVVLTVTDGSGNSATATANIFVVDTTAPTITAPANVAATTNTACTATGVDLGTPTTADNCSVASVTNDAPIAFPLGNTIVTWTVTDGSGRAATATQTVTVTDNINPTITCPSNISQNVGAATCTASVETSNPLTLDNCSVTKLTWALTGATVAGSAATGINNLGMQVFNLGTTTVTYRVEDAAGNFATCSFTVTVIDNEAPTITPGANQSVFTDSGLCTASVVVSNATFADNCTGSTIAYVLSGATTKTSTVGQVGTYTFNKGVTTITYTVTDATGNTIIGTKTITVVDNINPTITPGANQSVFTDSGLCTASVVVSNATFADNCTGSSISYTLGGATTKTATTGQVGTYTFNKGVTTITYTVSDAAGNTIIGSKTVTVTDNIPPVAPILNNITAQCSVTLTAPTTTDNCAGTIIGTTNDGLIYNTQGTYTVTWTFSDGNGNSISVPQNVIVNDNTPPVPNIANLEAVTSRCGVTLTAPMATDNCTSGNIIGTTNTTFPITTSTIVTWTYTDNKGNTTPQNQNVTILPSVISGGTLKGSIYETTPPLSTDPNLDDVIPITTFCLTSGEVNKIVIYLTGYNGMIDHWESSIDGGKTWINIGNSASSTFLVEFNIENSKTTLYRVVIKDLEYASCLTYSQNAIVHVLPPDEPPFVNTNDVNICLGSNVTLVATSGFVVNEYLEEGGDFSTGQFPKSDIPGNQWLIDGIGNSNEWTASGDATTKVNNWSGTNDSKDVGTNYIIKYNNGNAGKKFGIAHGNYNSQAYIDKYGVGPTTLESPIFSLEGFEEAILKFNEAFNLHQGDYALLELSLEGGAPGTYFTLRELLGTNNPPLSWKPYTPIMLNTNDPSDKRVSTTFNFGTEFFEFDLSNYVGLSNLRIKWSFFGTTDESAWAIDEITLPIKPIITEIVWTDGVGDNGLPPLAEGTLEVPYSFIPTAPGTHQYGATNVINTCRTYEPTGTNLVTVKVNYSYAGRGYKPDGICGGTTIQLNAYDNFKTASENIAAGAFDPSKPYDSSNDPGTGAVGKWTVVSANSCGAASFTTTNSSQYPDPASDPRAIFNGNAGTHTLTWTVTSIVNGVAVNCSDSVDITLTNCEVVDFDGNDDYISFKNNYGYPRVGSAGTPFSIEGWVKPESESKIRDNQGNIIGTTPNNSIQTIFSKRDATTLTTGYDLRLEGTTLKFNWNSGGMTSPYQLSPSRWYHLAVTYDRSNYILYVDGIEVVRAASSGGLLDNNNEFMVGAMDQSNNPPNRAVNYFSGWIDELRIWNTTLHPEHIRQMMNQEIKNEGINVRGEIIPIDINGPDANMDGVDDQPLYWSNLDGYYKMNQVDCGYLKSFNGKGVDGKLRNITSVQPQTAPLPYVSVRNGDWTNRNSNTTPWEFGSTVWDYPNSTGINGARIDWNIVKISHNITASLDLTLQGLISEAPDKELVIADFSSPIKNEFNSGHMLWITHYLKLNGSIDLFGESQLIQKKYGTYNAQGLLQTMQFSPSIIDVGANGFIKRDQQGQGNLYNYDDRSSPVYSRVNKTFTLKEVMYDGIGTVNNFVHNYNNIEFTPWSVLDGNKNTSPIQISSRWLYVNRRNTNYVSITSVSELQAGEGFTFKGSFKPSEITGPESQNYVFKGKPNNGTISYTMSAYPDFNLVGNPYPSALDADQFILDNKDVIYGAIYLYEDWGGDATHLVGSAHAGYAMYTLAGAVQRVAKNINNPAELGSKIPERYLPVSQGFWVYGKLGGTLQFKNEQRIFKRETDPQSTLFRTTSDTKNKNEAKRLKIRLGLEVGNKYQLQRLLTIDERTTKGIDDGFDGHLFDEMVGLNDIYWLINDQKFAIQAFEKLDKETIIPIGIKMDGKEVLKIKIDTIENGEENMKIFLRDNITLETFDITKNAFELSNITGQFNEKYSLVLVPNLTTESEDEVELVNLTGYYNDGFIYIKKLSGEIEINGASLFNMLGQRTSYWKLESMLNDKIIKLPVNIGFGVYILNISTNKGNWTQKIIVK